MHTTKSKTSTPPTTDNDIFNIIIKTVHESGLAKIFECTSEFVLIDTPAIRVRATLNNITIFNYNPVCFNSLRTIEYSEFTPQELLTIIKDAHEKRP